MLASFCSRPLRKHWAVLKLKRRPEFADARRPAFIRVRFPIRPTILGSHGALGAAAAASSGPRGAAPLPHLCPAERDAVLRGECVGGNTSEGKYIPHLLRTADFV